MYYKDDNHFVEATKVRSRVKTLAHEVFLDESIAEPEYYRNVVSLLRNQVADQDDVEIYISNGGGLAHTGSLLTDAMKACKGRLIGYLSGQVCSAATFIALQCDDWVVGDDVCFMIHTCSFGVAGDHSKVKDQHEFIQEWNEKLFRRTYEGFLTDEEIDTALTFGKEYWFNSDEVIERLSRYNQLKLKKQSSQMGDLFSAQEEQADQVEEVFLNKLISDGKVSQEEVEIARRVQKATQELDKSLSDSEFEKLMSETSETPSEDFTEDDYVPLEEQTLEELRKLADECDVKYAHNTKRETLIKKLIKYFEQ